MASKNKGLVVATMYISPDGVIKPARVLGQGGFGTLVDVIAALPALMQAYRVSLHQVGIFRDGHLVPDEEITAAHYKLCRKPKAAKSTMGSLPARMSYAPA